MSKVDADRVVTELRKMYSDGQWYSRHRHTDVIEAALRLISQLQAQLAGAHEAIRYLATPDTYPGGEVFGMPVVVDTRLPPGTVRLCGPCPKCAGLMSPGQAIQQTYTGIPDFPGDPTPVTVSPGGPGKLVDCLKCVKCGHSVTP